MSSKEIIAVSQNLPSAVPPDSSLSSAKILDLIFSEYTPNTRRAYARAFRDLQSWAGVSDVRELSSFDSLKLLDYKNHLKAQGKKASSVNQAMSALRKIFKILQEFGYIAHNPLKSSLLRTEKVSPLSNKGALRIQQLSSMLNANQDLAYDERIEMLIRPRNHLLLTFLYLTAARRSEVASLQWSDLYEDGKFHVAMLRETKSGVAQRLKIRPELHDGLLAWKESLRLHGLKTEWIFPSLSFRTMGKQMSGKGINDVVVRLGEAIGLKISAHYLRHTAITVALELGEPLQKVQSYARHASMNTTLRYYHDQQFLEKNPTDRLPMI